jgi:phage shock protein E
MIMSIICECAKVYDVCPCKEYVSAHQLEYYIKEAHNVMIIDVRSVEEYDDCHISGSVNIPFEELDTIAASWDKNQWTIVYCAGPSCSRAEQALRVLKNMNFINVQAYLGGLNEWRQRKLSTEGPCAQCNEKVM